MMRLGGNFHRKVDMLLRKTLGLLFFALASGAVCRADGPFKVAVLLPLTGPIAEYGVAAQAVVPVAEAQRFPVIAVSAEREIAANKNYVLRFCYSIDAIAEALTKYLRKNNFKKIAVVKAEIAYLNGWLNVMRNSLQADESISIIDSYQPGDSDFKTTLAKLKGAKFDALGVFLISGQVSQFYRDMRKLGIAVPTVGTDFFESMKEVRDAAGAMTGAVFTSPYVESGFVDRYVAEYKDDYQAAWAANSYEFALLTAKLFGNAGEKLRPEEVMKRFRETSGEQGTATTFRFDPSADGPGFELGITTRKVEADRIVELSGRQ